MDPNPTKPLNDTFFGNFPAENFFNDFPYALDNPQRTHPGQSTTQEHWLRDPPTASQKFAGLMFSVDNMVSLGDEVPIDVFQHRLATLMNTLWRSSVLPAVTLGGDIIPEIYSGCVPGPFIVGCDSMANFTASLQYWKDAVYTLNIPWIVIFCIADFILFIAAVVGLLFKLLCRGPAVLGAVSSLTRDSPYFSQSIQNGTAASASAKTRDLFD